VAVVIRTDELVGATEIAATLTLSCAMCGADLAHPVVETCGRLLRVRADVETWAANRSPGP
jgi:hypothetical protein